MAAKLTTETKAEATVALAPELRDRIAAILSTYHELKAEAKLYEELADAENKKIFALLEDAGIEKTEVEGTACAIVRGQSSSLDKVKFCELGGSLEMLENATVYKPKKAYLRIGKEK